MRKTSIAGIVTLGALAAIGGATAHAGSYTAPDRSPAPSDCAASAGGYCTNSTTTAAYDAARAAAEPDSAACAAATGAPRLYWGSLHEHTSWSLDAYFAGKLANGPAEAYQFAKGHSAYKTDNSTGTGVTINHDSASKLDWVALTDHSEFFDTQAGCVFPTADTTAAAYSAEASAYNSAYCQNYRKYTGDKTDYWYVRQASLGSSNAEKAPAFCKDGCSTANLAKDKCTVGSVTKYDCENVLEPDMWKRAQDIADRYNDTKNCTFSTLRAFEYSANAYAGANGTTKDAPANMHRNVIFRGTKTTSHALDAITYGTPGKMLTQLASECVAGGESTDSSRCIAISIPHNPNDSAGNKWILSTITDAAKPESKWNQLRARFETLVEIHQHKGSSECLNATQTGTDGVDGYDKWCEFELATTISGRTTDTTYDATTGEAINEDCVSAATDITKMNGEPCRKTDRPGYVRAALGKGLLEYKKGTVTSNNVKLNPMKLGITASLDSHNGTPGYVSESNWKGHGGNADDQASERLIAGKNTATQVGQISRFNPAGLTAAWAWANKRENIFDALAARETYATSGTRPSVWFYQVWLPTTDTTTDLCANFDPATIRARSGAKPMGGTMVDPGTGYTPRFVVYAAKDPNFSGTSGFNSHNLLEIDLVQTGVRGSGDNATVNDLVFKAYASNTATDSETGSAIGNSTICRVFKVGDKTEKWTSTNREVLRYQRGEPALWYARVLETPTRSWRYHDCVALGSSCPAAVKGTNNDYNTALAKTNERAWTSPIWYMP